MDLSAEETKLILELRHKQNSKGNNLKQCIKTGTLKEDVWVYLDPNLYDECWLTTDEKDRIIEKSWQKMVPAGTTLLCFGMDNPLGWIWQDVSGKLRKSHVWAEKYVANITDYQP